MAGLPRVFSASLIAAALCWAMPPAVAQTPPPAGSQELGAFAAKELVAGRYDAALKAAEDRLRADRRDGRAGFVRAAALTRLGRGPDAVAAFERYAKAGGKHRELDREWGLALMAAKRPAEAQVKFVSFLRANPGRTEVNLLIGRAAMLAEKFDESKAALKAAYDVGALRPRALALLMRLEMRRDHLIPAYWYLSELLTQHPGSREAKAYSAWLKRALPLSQLPESL